MAVSSDMFASGSSAGIDELLRAASAAGYAMAADEDDAVVPARTKSVSQSVSLEDSARGARETVAPVAPAGVNASSSYIPKTVRNGAHSVRDTVYGYLGYGVPA